MRKRNWMLIVLCVLIVVVTACSGNNGNTENAGNTNSNGNTPSENSEGTSENAPKDSGDPLEATALIARAINFPEENPVLNELRKNSGVHITINTVPGSKSDYESRLNTLLVTGDEPDIFSVTKTKITELIENDVIAPLNDLLEDHGQNILDNKGEFMKKGVAVVDGKIYGIPVGFVQGNALALRKDWLDKLEMDVPTTLDEYTKVLQAFVNNDPDGNNEKDTIGLGLSLAIDQNWEHIFAAFGVSQNRQMLVDGKVVQWMLAPGYLDAIKYLNSLHKQGLIDPEFITVPTLQSFEKLWNGKIGAYQFNAPGTTQNWLTRYVEDPKPEFVYTMIKGPNGQGGFKNPHLEDSGNYTVISNRSKNKVAAMKFLNYAISEEGNRIINFGIEGVHWKWKDGKENGTVEMIPPYDDAVALRNEGGAVYSTGDLMYRFNGADVQRYNEITREGIQMVLDNPIPDAYLYQVPQIQQEKGTIMADMEKEFRALAITSDGNLDQLYEDFKEKYLAEGGATWIEQATAIYNEEQAASE